MGENKGKGTKGRNYDELTGVGTSSAGITGTTGNLNTGTRDGGIGMPSPDDSGYRAGNRQSAEPDDGDTTPALGRGTRGRAGSQSQSSQGSQGGNQQSGQQGSQGSQSGNAQGGLGHSLDQDVMGKEQ
ncbi:MULTISPECIES: hypothetical protein [unclassified Massilia]|uniref:hypothetical protein n=1 Tax=unclassified Massilia TaxID=2609279 RepID=UPI00177E621C|nr:MULTISPECIES: hypothetical protein [unclassified Massilia]MBD8528640.1 hypothetical protein [Massilia sp. CFBP 13647]MBD8671737.1 hypothetical protein [Massilia sp. CFBP 13721]